MAAQPLVIILALLLLFQSGNELILGGYITAHLIRNLETSVTNASYLLAAYWAAIMLMRIVLSRILLRVGGHVLVLASALGLAASTALLILSPSRPVAALAVVLIGASIAAIFPTTSGTGRRAICDSLRNRVRPTHRGGIDGRHDPPLVGRTGFAVARGWGRVGDRGGECHRDFLPAVGCNQGDTEPCSVTGLRYPLEIHSCRMLHSARPQEFCYATCTRKTQTRRS